MTIHAHVSTESADCDGKYSRSYVLVSDEGQDVYDFKKEIVGMMLWAEENVTATFEPDGFSFNGPTEEGYVFAEIEWCDDSDCAMSSSFRDHSAEAAGY